MSQDLTVIQQAALPDAEKKASGWQVFGKQAALNEVQLAHEAKQLIEAIPLPTDISKLQEYDTQLAELKAEGKRIMEARAKDTSVTDAWKKRRMLPEQQIESHITAYASALLPLKQEAQRIADAEQARKNALAAFRTMAQQEYNDLQAKCNMMVANKVTDLYVRAIGNADCKAITPAIMEAMKVQFAVNDFAIPPIADQDTEKQAILVDIFTAHNPGSFVAAYHEQLAIKFSDFANAKQYAPEAIQQAKYEQETAIADIAETADIQNIAASMTRDSGGGVELAHKALKEVYVIDMPDDIPSAVAIVSAFVSLKGWGKLRTKSPMKASIEQMGAALAKMKSEDNALTISGITFKKEQKL